MKHFVILILSGLLALLIFGSCDKKPVPPHEVPDYDTRLIVLSTDNQSVVAGNLLTDSIRVRVLNQYDNPVSGVNIIFTQITQIDGSTLFPATVMTNDGSYASTNYIVDELVGIDTIQIVADSVDDSLVHVVINVLRDEPDTIVLVSPSSFPIMGIAGEPMDDTIKVMVTDQYSNPVANHRVLFETPDHSLVESDSTTNLLYISDSIITRTDENGIAWTIWHLSAEPLPITGLEYPNSSNLLVIFNFDDTLPVDTLKPPVYATGTDPGSFGYYNDIRDIFEKNCFLCHPVSETSDDINYYYSTVVPGMVEPGDSANSLLLEYARPAHLANTINTIEEDKVKLWVISDSAAIKSSRLNSYTSGIKDIIDMKCLACHNNPPIGNSYRMDSYAEILGNGSDGIPNAIPGDSASLLVQKILPGGTMRDQLIPDTTALSEVLIKWVIEDLLQE